LGEKIARHTKPNAMLEKADRPAHRVIPKSRFAKLDTIDEVIQRLIDNRSARISSCYDRHTPTRPFPQHAFPGHSQIKPEQLEIHEGRKRVASL
jgi:hypothetical protein